MATNEAIRLIDQLMSGETALETIEDVDAYVAMFTAHLANVRWEPTIQERPRFSARSRRSAPDSHQRSRGRSRPFGSVPALLLDSPWRVLR